MSIYQIILLIYFINIYTTLLYWIYGFFFKNCLFILLYCNILQSVVIWIYVLLKVNVVHFALKMMSVYFIFILNHHLWFWIINFLWIISGIFWAAWSLIWAQWWYGENIEENLYLLTIIYILIGIHFLINYRDDIKIYIILLNIYIYISLYILKINWIFLTKHKIFIFYTSVFFFCYIWKIYDYIYKSILLQKLLYYNWLGIVTSIFFNFILGFVSYSSWKIYLKCIWVAYIYIYHNMINIFYIILWFLYWIPLLVILTSVQHYLHVIFLIIIFWYNDINIYSLIFIKFLRWILIYIYLYICLLIKFGEIFNYYPFIREIDKVV